MLGRYRGPPARATGAGAPMARGGKGSEAVPCSQLQPPRTVGDAGRGVATPAAKVLVVEHVEHLEGQIQRLHTSGRHRLPQPRVDVPERKRMPTDEALFRG